MDGNGFLGKEGLPRRNFLRLMGIGGAAAAAVPLLASCSTGGGSGSTGLSAIGEDADFEAPSDEELAKILDYAQVDSSNMGAGEVWTLGAVLSFSGNGSFFGSLWQTGIDLAIEHIAAIGGPTIKIESADNGSGDAQKSNDAIQRMVQAKVPGIIGSQAIGGVFDPLARHKILCLDSGAGAPIGLQGIPYYYGARSAYNSDQWVGTMEYMKVAMSDKKKVISIDNVSTLNDPIPELEKLFPDYGFDYLGSVTAQIGATDYSAVIAQIRNQQPDVVWASISQFDLGYFMKQYATSGIKAPVFAFQWTRAAREIAGQGYQNQYFSTEFLDIPNPANPWQDLFIRSYAAKYGETPVPYAANFYSNVFMWWQLMRDVIAGGGDFNDGEQLLNALETNPSFPTVFGGDSETPGIFEMDLELHSPKSLPQSVFLDTGEELEEVARYDVNGTGFEVI